MRFWNHFYILIIANLFMKCAISQEQNSCKSACSDVSSPRCGTWLQDDNVEESSGIYLLNEALINLTCTFTSLPTPVAIDWSYKSHHTSLYTPIKCASVKTTTECSSNKFGEHKVSSTCYLKIDQLNQSGHYHCSASDGKGSQTKSKESKIHVYGISKLETIDDQTLHYGQIDKLEALVCAHPKPSVIWMHPASSQIVTAGGTPGKTFVALDLIEYIDVPKFRGLGALAVEQNCYVSQLVLNDIAAVQDGRFAVMASNAVDYKTVTINVDVIGVPLPTTSTGSTAKSVTIYWTYFHVSVIFMIWYSLV